MVSIVKIETITTQKIEKVVFVNAKTKQNRKWKHLNPTTFPRIEEAAGRFGLQYPEEPTFFKLANKAWENAPSLSGSMGCL